MPKQLYRWSAVCGESRMHGVKRGKIHPDCGIQMDAVKEVDYLSL